MTINVSMQVNGKAASVNVEERTLLVTVLREELRLTGTHVGCDTAQCGACTVQLDGRAVKACNIFAAQAHGANVTTIEGIGKTPLGAKVQAAWVEANVPQCGYCQAGQIMSATALLSHTPKPDDSDIDAAMAGNICRCGTYIRIRRAIHRAASA